MSVIAPLMLASLTSAAVKAQGVSGTVSRTNVSRSLIVRLIEKNLSENQPVVTIRLLRRLNSHAPKGYTDLERAGILQEVAVNGGSVCDIGPAYRLSEKGRAEAISRQWRVSGSSVVIPMGHFQYVPGSAVVNPRPSREMPGLKDTFDLSIKYRFDGNANAADLLKLGSGKDWVVSGYKHPSPHLSDVGHVRSKTLMLYRWHGSWAIAEFPYYEAPGCSDK